MHIASCVLSHTRWEGRGGGGEELYERGEQLVHVQKTKVGMVIQSWRVTVTIVCFTSVCNQVHFYLRCRL